MTEPKYLGPPASAAGNIMGWEWMKVTLGRVCVCECVCGSVVLLQFYTLSWLMSSWYGMWAGRYVCSRAQKARPSLQLLLKLVTSIFCGQIIKKKEDIRVLKQKKIPANQSQYPIMIMWWKSRGLWWALPKRMQLGFENHKEQHENKTFIISFHVLIRGAFSVH